MSGAEPLERSFYEVSAEVAAPLLLGHWLVRRTAEGELCGGTIVETEAYLVKDPACHAFRGETKRNRSMFGVEGHSYVYLIYGMHHCFNTVCCGRGIGEAVLVRAIEAEMGVEQMRSRRAVGKLEALTSGPAKLCAALGIDRRHDGLDLCGLASELMVLRNPARSEVVERRGPIRSGPRVGISQAADWPLRFGLAGSRYLSRSL